MEQPNCLTRIGYANILLYCMANKQHIDLSVNGQPMFMLMLGYKMSCLNCEALAESAVNPF